MLRQNKFANGNNEANASVSLIAVYNTISVGKYRNNLLRENQTLFCLIYTKEGNGYIELSNHKRIELTKDTVFFGRHSEIMAIGNEEEWHFHCYWFQYFGLEIPLNYRLSITPNGEEDDTINEIIDLLNKHDYNSNLLANSKFMIFLLNVKNQINDDSLNDKDYIKEIIQYICVNSTSNIKIKDVAKEFGYCEKHLRNLIKKYIGMSPKQYLLKINLEKASRLLMTSSMSIEEISLLLAFSSTPHFSNAFKKMYGVSPNNYRKSNQN